VYCRRRLSSIADLHLHRRGWFFGLDEEFHVAGLISLFFDCLSDLIGSPGRHAFNGNRFNVEIAGIGLDVIEYDGCV
jgi:hypothetical protein